MKLALALLLAAAMPHASAQTGVVIVNTNLAYENGAAAGTGIVLTSSGEVLTNNHVIRGSKRVRVVVPGSHTAYAASVLGYDVSADVAVLQLQHASGLATAAIGDSSRLARGQTVTAVGNAGGTGALTVTTGRITGLDRTITVSNDQGETMPLAGLLETDAPLRPGDSGGPLLDGAGRVIGVDTAASPTFVFHQSRDAYAIPINRAVAIARQIVARRGSAQVHVGDTAFLGVQVQQSGMFEPGVVVGGVVSGGPVAKAGVVAGDLITAVGGRQVKSAAKLVSALLVHHPGDKVELVWTNALTGKHSSTITLASGPPQ